MADLDIRHASQYTLERNAPLENRNTFRVPARAAWLADIHAVTALPELLAKAELRNFSVLALSGGSNVLITQDINGLVLHMAIHGIEILDAAHDGARVRVAAGENWDHFVRWSLAARFSGLENLILIPGSVGAAPIQNIGAYGTELSEFVEIVEAWDRKTEKFVRLDNAACQFSYRNSLFKSNRERYIVTAVEFSLPRERPLRVDYAGIRQELQAMSVKQPTSITVGRAVERLRRRKLPDPAKIGNAGSFFKNPLVSLNQLHALRDRYPNLPAYPHDEERYKLSAAWLIESSGLKGIRKGTVGVSEKHALVLVNHGAATGAELWALAMHIRAIVNARFGITLVPEPVIL